MKIAKYFDLVRVAAEIHSGFGQTPKFAVVDYYLQLKDEFCNSADKLPAAVRRCFYLGSRGVRLTVHANARCHYTDLHVDCENEAEESIEKIKLLKGLIQEFRLECLARGFNEYSISGPEIPDILSSMYHPYEMEAGDAKERVKAGIISAREKCQSVRLERVERELKRVQEEMTKEAAAA